jgi:hypothetical protein
MAVVGEAHIIVRAITTKVRDDIKKGFDGVDDVISESGKRISKSFSGDFYQGAEQAKKAWQKLVKTGYVLQTVLGTVVGAIGSVVGAAGALAGSIGGAAGSIGALSGVIAALPAGMATFKLALSGVGAAVSSAIKANKNYASSLQEARNQLKQLKNDAEEAALAEDEAALRLQKAREALLLTADLPANSIARQQAVLDYRRADLEYRRAAERNKDLKKELANPTAGAKQADPFADLTASQKEFAKYLVSLYPLIKQLKEAASNAFLPILQDQIDRLVNGTKGVATFFETIKNGIKRTGAGLSSGVTNFVNALTDSKNLARLKDVFEGIQPVFEVIGKVFGNLYTSFLAITEAALPAMRTFVNFIESKTSTFANFLDTQAASGRLTAFFNRATQLAGNLGRILGNVGAFFGDIIEANFGPASGGQYLLSWLGRATEGWKTLDDRVGESQFSGYFFSASVNARAVLVSIGKLIKELGKLGTDDSIRQTFDILAQGAPYLAKIMSEGAKAGPVLAELIVSITKIISSFSDAGAIRVFFDVLNQAASVFAAILENEALKNIMNFIAQLLAVTLAINVLKGVFVFAGKVIAASILPIIARLKGVELQALSAEIASSKFMAVARSGGIWVTAIAAVVMGVIALNDEFERAQKESLTTGEAIRNLFSKGTATSSILNEALKDLTGTLVYSKETIRGNVISTDDWSYSISDIATNAETFKLTIKLLGNEIDNLNKRDIGTQDWFDDEEQWYRVKEQFLNIGTALNDIALSDLPTAQKAFKGITAQFKLSDEQATDLINSLGPEFKESMRQFSIAAGGSGSDMEILNIALGRGETALYATEVALYGVEGAAEKSRQRIKDLAAEIAGFGSVTLDTRAAQREFENAIDAVTKSLSENGKSLDTTTEAGRANNAALDALVKSGGDFALSMYKSNGNSEEFANNMLIVRDRLVEAAKKFGKTQTEAEALADQLVGSKYDIKIKVKELTKKEADAAILATRTALAKAGASGFSYVLTANDIANIKAGKIKVGTALNQRYGGYINAFSAGVSRFAPGGPVFGAGTGTSDSIPAMLSNGEFVVNANATAKNRSLLEAINSGNKSASIGSSVNITVNPSPGMDEKELATEVSRQLAFAMRKGSSY